ncbi:MAG: GGDEF domain-containing protein [Chromatiales bacterium]|nr:GGDEF domain-containing protein [Chromatiales bacterium]
MTGQISSMTETESRFIAAKHTPLGQGQGYVPKILALSGILQTTLEINELIALFAKELGHFVEFEGIAYQFPSLAIDIKLGSVEENPNSCAYQLLVAEQRLGTLKLMRTEKFNDQELELIENLLSALLYPLRNTLLYQQAVNSASIDPLTGVYNRIAMESTIKREIGLAQRHHSALSLIILDIDHFKEVNDCHGHLYGDQVITAVAQAAKQTIRESDAIFRYGGEEFLILLNNTAIDGAELLAERIRNKINNLKPHTSKDISITISLGVTTMQEDDDMASFVNRADKALYEAKHTGRNRVVCI